LEFQLRCNPVAAQAFLLVFFMRFMVSVVVNSIGGLSCELPSKQYGYECSNSQTRTIRAIGFPRSVVIDSCRFSAHRRGSLQGTTLMHSFGLLDKGGLRVEEGMVS